LIKFSISVFPSPNLQNNARKIQRIALVKRKLIFQFIFFLFGQFQGQTWYFKLQSLKSLNYFQRSVAMALLLYNGKLLRGSVRKGVSRKIS